jgi:beta-lactamase regulating signal transducer with metallopeptidase domain
MTTAIAVSVDITIILTLALLICAALYRRPAALRHMVLAAALGAAAAIPLLEAALPHWEVPVLPGASTAASSGLALSDQPIGSTLEIDTQVASTPVLTWSTALTAVWALGFLIVITRLLGGFARLVVMSRRCRPLQSNDWRDRAMSLCARFDLPRAAVLESSDCAPLLTWGMRKPRIIVPAGAAMWTPARIEAVLAHELAHIARRDWAVQIAAQIVCAAYWFNPLIWIACRRLRDESERACDDAVLRLGVSPADYATHLLAVARQVLAGGHRWASAPAIVNSSSLERRIAAMLNPSCSRQALTSAAGALTFLGVFAVTAPIAAVTLTERVRATIVAPTIGRDVALTAPESRSEESSQAFLTERPAAGLPSRVRRAAAPAVAMPAAQAPASLSVVLRDASGAVLPGVQVTLTNTAAGASYPAVSDAGGRFTLRNIPPARYELTARLPGFRSISEVVDLSAGGEQQLSLGMQVGGLVETVRVSCPSGAAALPRGALAPFAAIDRRATAALFALPQAAQPPIRVGGQIAAPRQIATASPTCPGVPPGGGYVVILEATIGVDGAVRDVLSLRPRVPDQQQAPFVQAAIDAITQWQYTPTRLNNEPIPVIMTVTVQFSSQ